VGLRGLHGLAGKKSLTGGTVSKLALALWSYGCSVKWMLGWQQKKRQHSELSCLIITESPISNRSMVGGCGAAVMAYPWGAIPAGIACPITGYACAPGACIGSMYG